MIPMDRPAVLETALELLAEFGRQTDIRGRFVAMYLGFRRMGPALAKLGSDDYTSAIDIQQFLDLMWAKSHRDEPLVVLTAPFGGSTSPTAPYSTRTGEKAPANAYPTNTWRNNFGIQKGIGCPAESDVVARILESPTLRLSCPHLQVDPEMRHVCGIQGTSYRGEEHAIWLRGTRDGYQVVDLDIPRVRDPYLLPGGKRIPVFPLIAILYAMSPAGIYPPRARVGIPDFAADFGFQLADVEQIFDCDPDSVANMALLAVVEQAQPIAPMAPVPGIAAGAAAGALPELGPAGALNTGVGAELAVAEDLQRRGWNVSYRGNQRGHGYDLEAERDGATLRIEVKSSIAFTTPELLESEWEAAQRHGESYVLAVVDFYGSDRQEIWYVRDPANAGNPIEIITRTFRFMRSDLAGVRIDAEFL